MFRHKLKENKVSEHINVTLEVLQEGGHVVEILAK